MLNIFCWFLVFGAVGFFIAKTIGKKMRADSEREKQAKREAREDMLRILLTRASLEKFQTTIEQLRWVETSSKGSPWGLCLPKKDFASPTLIGNAFGSIIKNRRLWWGSEDVLDLLLKDLAQQIDRTYDKQPDIDSFLEGMTKEIENPEDSIRLGAMIKKVHSEQMSLAEKLEIQQTISAGLEASGINIKEDCQE